MALQTPGSTSQIVRHHIQEIAVQPTTSEYPTKLEVFVDGQPIHRLPTIKSGQTLLWGMRTFPCNVHSGSTIGLKLIEKHHMSPDLEVLAEYTILDATNQSSITKRISAFPSRLSVFGIASKKPNPKTLMVTVKFLDPGQIANNSSETFARAAKIVEGTQGPLDRLGNYGEVMKTILGFAEVVAELHPTAKLVIGLCTKAWEHLEKIQKQYEDLQRLMDGLMGMQPFIDSVKDRAKEPALRNTVLALLHLIEETCNFVINSTPQTSTERVMRGLNEATASHGIEELLQKFGDLKENFDRGVGVEVLKQVLSTAQRDLINQLKPSAASLNTMPSSCHEGTRTQAIADICTWLGDSESPQKLLWLYGQAGMGKSSIAASVCQVFHDAGTLGAHFFFKRDDPYLRSPDHMLNVIVHRLACQYEPYGRAVASAIDEYNGLLEMPLGQRYTHLIERPLRSLESGSESSLKTFVIVVDALDECENTDSRRPLFTYLREMSQLVPWIKIVITSRPDQDIETAFDSAKYNHVASRSIASYDASEDILKYTQKRMTEMAECKKQPQWSEDSIRELSTRAAGLFIWVETACKFIERGANMEKRRKQVLAGTQSAEGSRPLDLLYATAIKQGMGDEDPDNVQVFRECIGAIVATAARTPLSVAGLESLLSGHENSGLFRVVVSGLGSVLYEDASQGGAVRVYHPSFADFILDPTRSGSFYTDPQEQNTTLADFSLRTMMRELRFDICGLETSHILNRDVADLKTRVHATIGEHLAYSCLHWSSHLSETPKGSLQGPLGDFLYGRQLLYWIEAMSLLGRTNAALSNLLGLIDWLSNSTESHSSYANDAYRFILAFYDAISQSTPHLYISALAFAPTKSKLAQQMRKHFSNTFTAILDSNEVWPTWLQSIPHSEPVLSVVCSANGRRIVSGCLDGAVQAWDSETGAAVSEPFNHPGVCRVAISSNGQLIASGSSDGTLRVWDAETGAAPFDPFGRHPADIVSLTLSSDCNRLFSSDCDCNVLVWDINTKTLLFELRLDHSARMNSTALSPDERLLASCSDDQTVRIWDTKTGAPLTEPLVGHSDSVNCVAFSPNGRIIATGSDDATMRVWDVNTGRSLRQPITGHSNSVQSVAFSPNGRYLVSGSDDRTVRVWDVDSGMPVCSPLVGHLSWVTSVAFCSNSQRVVSASDDTTMLIWDVGASVASSKSLAGHTNVVNSVAFSCDGRYVASGSHDCTVRVWDARSGDEAFAPLVSQLGVIKYVRFMPNSRRIVSSAGRNTVRIQDVETGVLETEFTLGDSHDVSAIALSPDGKRLVSGSKDGRVGVWDAETGTAVFTPISSHPGQVASVAFSPDSRFIASGSKDIVRIWEAETGAPVGEPLIGGPGSVLSICFSPNSLHIASSFNDDTVRVWVIKTGAVLFENLQAHLSWTGSILFTPEGHYIISTSNDDSIQLWDARTGASIANPFEGHSDEVSSIALSADGRWIATGSWDFSVRIWDVENRRTHDQLAIDELFAAPSDISISTSILAHHINESGWVTSSNGVLLLWLPKQLQHADDSLVHISAVPTPNHLLLDFSKFVHGDSWASVSED